MISETKAMNAGAKSSAQHSLVITAGVGPMEVRRFVKLLSEHLAAECIAMGLAVRGTFIQGEGEAPFSVELQLAGDSSLSGRFVGTHALVARSNDRGKKARKRWYAGVSLSVGAALETIEPKVARQDVTIVAMRAGGPGGQHVNKTSSAVRVTHAQSGVTVRVAEERSQHENVRKALKKVNELLIEKSRAQAGQSIAQKRLSHYKVERGRPAFVYELSRAARLTIVSEATSV